MDYVARGDDAWGEGMRAVDDFEIAPPRLDGLVTPSSREDSRFGEIKREDGSVFVPSDLCKSE